MALLRKDGTNSVHGISSLGDSYAQQAQRIRDYTVKDLTRDVYAQQSQQSQMHKTVGVSIEPVANGYIFRGSNGITTVCKSIDEIAEMLKVILVIKQLED